MTEYKQHPLSAAFPSMSGLDIQNLAGDIRENGQREPGMLYQGMVLDGWHRYLACVQAGAVFRAHEFGDGDPVSFVLSRNLHRRHLTGSQRASSIVACKQWKPGGRPGKGAAAAGFSNAELAKEAEVSERTIANAKAAHKAGLGEAVTSGEISAETAAEIGKLPKSKRAKAIKDAKEKKPAPPKPKKDSPEEQTIAALKARIAELEEYQSEAARMAEAAAIFNSEEGYRNLKGVLAELESVKRTRNDYMRECAQQKTQIAHLEREIKKLKKK